MLQRLSLSSGLNFGCRYTLTLLNTSLLRNKMTLAKTIPLFLLLAPILSGQGANILFFYGGGTYSHKNAIWPLVSALADKGHNVTLLSPFVKQPFKNPRVNDVVPLVLQQEMKNIFGTDYLQERREGREHLIWINFPDWVARNCRLIAEGASTDPELRQVLYESKYDLIVTNGAFSECGSMWAYYHGTKFVTALSTSIFSWHYEVYDLPTESAWIPDLALKYNFPMNLYERAFNYLWKLYTFYERVSRTYVPVEDLMVEVFNLTERPNMLEIERQASLVLVNTYSGTEYGRPLPPYFIQVGGMQCWAPKNSLPDDFQAYLDGAIDGAVLIAFGSTVDFSGLHSDVREAFFQAIKAFPKVRFLWKWNGPEPANKPDNIFFSKWLPQREILAHPNTRAFVSHCGLNSLMEATYEGVPIVAVPLFGDQDYNAYHIQAHQLGVSVEARELTAELLAKAINEILNNSIYKENMAQASAIFRDRPMNPIETGVFWLEFAIRNGNTTLMKPLSYGLSWWQRHLLDVFTLLFASLAGLTIILVTLLSMLVRRMMKVTRGTPPEINKKTD